MLSSIVQDKFNEWIKKFCNENNIGMYRNNPIYFNLVTRLNNVTSDSAAMHIIANYQKVKYALAYREKISNDFGGLYKLWTYQNLLTGGNFPNIVFTGTETGIDQTDTTKIIVVNQKPTDIYIDNENGSGNGNGGNGDTKSGCDNKNISASGRTFSYCVPYTITEFGKVYGYPLKMKVSGGTLNRYDLGTGFGYTFTPTVVDTGNGNGSGNGNDEIITGVDNTFLIVGAIALFLMMKS